jgi:hypothetical protein
VGWIFLDGKRLMLINLSYNVDLPARRSILGVSCSSRTAKRSLAQYARLLSVGVKWLAIVLAVAMALDHLRIASAVFQLAFGILFGGIDRIRLGARSWAWLEGICHQIAIIERDAKKVSSDTVEDPLRHL